MSIDAVFSVDIERARALDVAIFGGNAVCRAVDGVLEISAGNFDGNLGSAIMNLHDLF